MEYFVAAFLGGWLVLFGILYAVVMKKEYSHYFDEKEGSESK